MAWRRQSWRWPEAVGTRRGFFMPRVTPHSRRGHLEPQIAAESLSHRRQALALVSVACVSNYHIRRVRIESRPLAGVWPLAS
eukprot:5803951-Alexandrium_andersonii.AAC.1